MSKKVVRLDEIGYWSEVKLDIVRKYAAAYSTIMAKQPSIPMRNERGAVIYYLYFASPNNTGARIVSEIFDSYRTRGTR